MSQDTQQHPAEPENSSPIPTLDFLMPPLDRRGRRGRKTNEELSYERQRAAVGGLLERLRASEAALKETEERRASAQQDVNYYMNIVTRLQDQLGRTERTHSESLRKLMRAILTVTQFVRLTGLEAHGFVLRTINSRFELRFKAREFELTTVLDTDPPYLLVSGPGRRPTRFELTCEGAIPTMAVLALLTFVGLQRDPEEAYPQSVYTEVVDQPALDRSVQDLLDALGTPLIFEGLPKL